jgi:hypothetical protein
MKKKNFNPVAKVIVLVLVGLSTFSSCKKSDQAANANPPELAGDWKLSDLMLVNAGDKPSRKFEEIPKLDDLRFILSPDGRITAGGGETGTWSVVKDRLHITFDGDELFDVKVTKLDPAFMLLEHGFDGANGGDGGTIYYAFAR